MFGQDVKWVEFTPEEFVDYLLRLKLVDTEEEASKELAFVMRNGGRYTRMTRRLKTEISIIPNKLIAEKGDWECQPYRILSLICKVFALKKFKRKRNCALRF